MAPKRPLEDVSGSSSKERKKQRITQARTIDTQSGQGFGVVANTSSGLPSAIDVEKFTEAKFSYIIHEDAARSFEIAAMQSARASVEGNATQRVWQTLPRSLRRRAASHDVRRVPVRLREKARAEMDPVKRKTLNKRLSKAGMSKAITKTQQYLNRQRDKTWLETHIWHAKRMHMKNLWGYRLAATPTEKSYRPSHRSSVHSSILHDASYFGIISLSGKQSVLEKLLNGCCDCQGSSPGAVRYSLGSRIQDTHLYKWHSYPFDLIAPITIIWKSFSAKNGNESNSSNPGETQVNTKKNMLKKAKEKEALSSLPTHKPDPSTKRTLWIRVHPSAWNEVWDTLKEACSHTVKEIRQDQEKDAQQNPTAMIPEESIELTDLRSRVNCFEIMGPRSSQVLRGVLSVIDREERKIFHQFWSQLRDVQTPAAVPRGMVVGLKVIDPRLGFPPKNAKAAILKDKDNAMPSTSQSVVFSVAPSVALAQSELWDEVERDGGPLRPRFRKKDLDDRRRQNLVPGTHLRPEKQDDRVPLLLMQRSISSQSSITIPARSSPTDSTHIHGWSLFFPAHWSMAFLNALTHTGTRVGALRERRTQVFESGLPDFPFDYPCTNVYEQEAALSAQAEKEAWEKKPPAKRVEWDSVNTKNPWRADWRLVLGILSETDLSLLQTQREAVERTHSGRMWLLRGVDVRELIHSIAHASDPGFALLDELNRYRNKRGLTAFTLASDVLLGGALISVRLTICGRGAPNDLAAIYDIGDPKEANEIRQLLSGKHTGDIYGDANQKLSELTAKDDPVIGYVTTGNYSLSRGQGLAIGAISLSRFIAIVLREKQFHINSYPLLVKVKDRHSLNCRVASIQILAS